MEFNTPKGIDNSYDHIVWSSSDSYHLGSSGVVRSYTCAFCRRGFSNAQALGGHMNIHRKDRAKLRQLSDDDKDDDEEEISLSLGLKNTSPIKLPHIRVPDDRMWRLSRSNEDCFTQKLGFQTDESKLDTTKEVMELPFFVEVANSSMDDERMTKASSSGCDQNNEKYLQLTDGHYHHETEGLDLELRLGRRLDKSLRSSTSTRKFL